MEGAAPDYLRSLAPFSAYFAFCREIRAWLPVALLNRLCSIQNNDLRYKV
jgi:hypothetical protein